MTSVALSHWTTVLLARLDELEQIHATAKGRGPGRRWGTEQLNGQLFVALVGQFQGFARALHDEALDWLREQSIVARQLAEVAARNRSLDRGNPHPGALGEDFGRLGMRFSTAIDGRRHGRTRLGRLDAAVTLRNGIAHSDESKLADAERLGAFRTLRSYRRHRGAIERLAVDMDAAVAHHLHELTGLQRPW